VVVADSCTINFVLPIIALEVFIIIESDTIFQIVVSKLIHFFSIYFFGISFHDFFLQVDEIVAVHQVHGVSYFANTDTTIIRESCFSGFTLLGCDDNNTIGTTRTVDRCCRSIFQYVDGFNIVRVEGAHSGSLTWETVNNV